MKKNSQITLFVIMGIVILIVFSFLFYSTKTIAKIKLEHKIDQITTDLLQTSALKYYITLCLEKTAKQGVDLITKQGGRIFQDQGGLFPYPGNHSYGTSILPFGNSDVYYGITEYQKTTNPIYGYYSKPPNYLVGDGIDFFGLKDLPALCDPNGPNKIAQFPKKYYPCQSYSPRFPIQNQLNNYIENQIKDCVNISIFSNVYGYEIHAANPESNIIFGENDIITELYYPINISVQGFEPITKILGFKSKIKLRLKKLYEFAEKIINIDQSNVLFDIEKNHSLFGNIPGFKIQKHKNTYQFDSMITVTDEFSLIDGKPLTLQFGIKNREPALEWIHETHPSQELDFIKRENETIIINPQAYDADEETEFTFDYTGWMETWDEELDKTTCLANITDCRLNPSKYTSVNHNKKPHNWTNSFNFINSNPNTSYKVRDNWKDVGFHNLTLKVTDKAGLSDWQIIKILIADIPIVNIFSNHPFPSINKTFVSLEDPFHLEAQVHAVFSKVENYNWTIEDISFIKTENKLKIPENPNIGTIKNQHYFKNLSTNNILLTLKYNNLPYKDKFYYDLSIKQCFPHRSSTPIYPYNSQQDTQKYFLADHTCCADDYTIKNPTFTCFKETTYGANYSFNNNKYKITHLPPKPYPSIQYPNITSTQTHFKAQNDLFQRTFERKCSGERGNICNGTATEKRIIIQECEDITTDERCSGPITGILTTKSSNGCVDYSPGYTFEHQSGPNNPCDYIFKCVTQGDNGYLTLGQYYTQGFCDNSGNCDHAAFGQQCRGTEEHFCQSGQGNGCMNLCFDNVDNDNNGCPDSQDFNCGGTETTCGDNQDNDCDTLTDCDDPDCQLLTCTNSNSNKCNPDFYNSNTKYCVTSINHCAYTNTTGTFNITNNYKKCDQTLSYFKQCKNGIWDTIQSCDKNQECIDSQGCITT